MSWLCTCRFTDVFAQKWHWWIQNFFLWKTKKKLIKGCTASCILLSCIVITAGPTSSCPHALCLINKAVHWRWVLFIKSVSRMRVLMLYVIYHIWKKSASVKSGGEIKTPPRSQCLVVCCSESTAGVPLSKCIATFIFNPGNLFISHFQKEMVR